MAYSNSFLKVTWNFSIASTDEIAQTSLNFSSETSYAAAVARDAIDDTTGQALITAMGTLMGNVQLQWASYSRLTGIRVAAVGMSGAELGEAVEIDRTTPIVGLENNILPQATIVVSLRSSSSSGSGNRGRMYLPHVKFPLMTASPYAAGTSTAGLVSAAATFINSCETAINFVTDDTCFAAIMSQVGSGTHKQITEVRVGNVVDTQRRRRNQLPETYATAAV